MEQRQTEAEKSRQDHQEQAETEAAQEHLSVEEALERLEEMVGALEDPELSIEEAFTCYEKGMELLKYCNDSIDAVEKKVLAISKEGEIYEF